MPRINTRSRKHALYCDALTRLPDHLVQRVYENNLAIGKRQLANYAAIEAGRRLTKRALPFDPVVAGEMKLIYAEMDAEERAAMKIKFAAFRRKRL